MVIYPNNTKYIHLNNNNNNNIIFNYYIHMTNSLNISTTLYARPII